MRGRRPDPEGVKDQKAPVRSRQTRRVFDHGSAAGAGGGLPPNWLKKEGLKVWDRLAPTLRAAKLLTDADTQTFGRYCRNFARWLKMQEAIDKEGEAYESESQWGKLKRVNPSFLIADRLERQLLAAEDRFGLNPAERQRIFAARAQTGVSGDLFSAPEKTGERRKDDPAAQATQAADPIESPIGLLN
jgi:P27 family predicted phage terminase small subunit